MRSYGTFDDRDDARLRVKQWLSTNDPESYSPQCIRELVSATVRSDTEPVDGIHDSWREASYGAMIGIGEFAGEGIARMAQQLPDGTMREALDATNRALSCLPHNPAATRTYLSAAQRCIHDARPQSAIEAQRALRAIGLARELLGP